MVKFYGNVKISIKSKKKTAWRQEFKTLNSKPFISLIK